MLVEHRLSQTDVAKLTALVLSIILTTYLVTFLPYFFLEPFKSSPLFERLWSLQKPIWLGQWKEIRHSYDHPYNSYWWQWVLSIRPISYEYARRKVAPDFARGVMMLGNQIVMWVGLPATIYCLIQGVTQKKLTALALGLMYCSLTFCWLFFNRKKAFYYYYFPAGMMLSFTITYALKDIQDRFLNSNFFLKNIDVVFVSAVFGMFVFFYPVLSGEKILDSGLEKWIWLESWI